MTIKTIKAEDSVAKLANVPLQSFRQKTLLKIIHFHDKVLRKKYLDSFSSGEDFFLPNPNGMALAQRDLFKSGRSTKGIDAIKFSIFQAT